ncbi:unnamed protein product, partial [Nesidiocoris tenuis]
FDRFQAEFPSDPAVIRAVNSVPTSNDSVPPSIMLDDELEFGPGDTAEEEFVLDLIRTYDIKNSQDRGYRLLQEATKYKHKAAIRLLIDKGAAVNSDKYFASYTPLHWAVRGGDREIVELLLDRGAILDDETWEGLSPFYLAVSGGVEVTHLYLSDCEKTDVSADMVQISADLTPIVSLLLSRGSDVNQKCWEGQTPLHLACISRSPHRDKTIDLLLERGARVNFCDNFGNTPLHAVAVSDVADPCSVIGKLLRFGADINAATYVGETPLHASCRSRSPEMRRVVRLLVESGANVNARNLRGCTPLHSAVSRFQFEMSMILLNKGADLNIANNAGATPLHLMLRNIHLPMLRHIAKVKFSEIVESELPGNTRGLKYYLNFREEIDRMKMRIGSSTATYYDFITAGDRKLALLVSNDEIRRTVEENAPETFPEYSKEIEERLAVGVKRSAALVKLKSLNLTAGGVSLTYDSKLRLADYLTNEDLENLIASSTD